MPKRLRRYYGKGHLHFITFSCYRRLPLLKSARARDLFVRELAKLREELGFRLIGYGWEKCWSRSTFEERRKHRRPRF